MESCTMNTRKLRHYPNQDQNKPFSSVSVTVLANKTRYLIAVLQGLQESH